MKRPLLLETMTSPDVRAALDAGVDVAIVACGAVEQHGPHLPLFMDAEHGTRLAEAVASRLGRALVAPTIRVGCSEHHMRFPGSMTVSEATLEALCHDYARSLARHGFRHIFFLPTHGGNFAPLRAMLGRLGEAVAPHARVGAFTDLQAQIALWTRVVEEEAGLGSRVGGHADVAETSLMMHMHPELVRLERAEPGYAGTLTPQVLETVFTEGIGAVAPNGILGDARGASAEIGRRCLEETADLVAARFAALLAVAGEVTQRALEAPAGGEATVRPDGSG